MIKLRNFRGALPKLHPALLPDGYAQVARNAKFRSGGIIPYREPLDVNTLGAPAAVIRRIAGAWQGFAAQVWSVRGPVATDRIYIAGDGVPRVEAADGSYSYGLKLTTPTTTPTVTLASGTVDPDLAESIVFAYTWVTDLGEESQPSPVSDPIDWSPGCEIGVGNIGTAPASRGVSGRRMYRSVTGYDGTTVLHYVGETSVGAVSFTYDDTHDIAEPIPSTDYDPPSDSLTGFTAMPNGLIAGWFDNTLCFCEPYIPHAWPIKYRVNLDSNIVGLVSFADRLVVMTEGQPYIIMGIHPSAMTVTEVEDYLPCLSARGVVDLGYAAAYPSNDGLVLVDVSGARVVSRDIYSRDDWQALAPDTFVAAAYDGCYVFAHQPDPAEDPTIRLFDLTGERPFDVEVETAALDLYGHPNNGKLYILNPDGVTVQEFDPTTGNRMTAFWRSKRFMLPHLVSFPWGRLDAELNLGIFNSEARFYGSDGVEIGSMLPLSTPGRLPGGRLDDIIEIVIEGTAEVYSMGLGMSPADVV